MARLQTWIGNDRIQILLQRSLNEITILSLVKENSRKRGISLSSYCKELITLGLLKEIELSQENSKILGVTKK
ncbi:MAG TPA: hypothetical protein VJB94_01615 [Candidatus Nanoarchaeia archaeon]|nr:hypothetical protein [Candidatus Nanoarchaeia archaeon]